MLPTRPSIVSPLLTLLVKFAVVFCCCGSFHRSPSLSVCVFCCVVGLCDARLVRTSISLKFGLSFCIDFILQTCHPSRRRYAMDASVCPSVDDVRLHLSSKYEVCLRLIISGEQCLLFTIFYIYALRVHLYNSSQ